MFAYFGYGSNINLTALKAKGVEPITSEKASLPGWKLTFNVKHWFNHEGGVGNIQKTSNINDIVEGVIHKCKKKDLKSLDTLEAYGIGYDRIEVHVETEKGETIALAYIGLPAFIDNTCLPSQRYLNIIVKGAEAAGLSKSYIHKLRNHPVHKVAEYSKFIPPVINGKTFTKQTLAQHPQLTALAGAVFDMKEARNHLKSVIPILGGKDMTLFHLKRHDKSNGEETIDDFINGRITIETKDYLNAYLNEYSREFKYVGRFVYGDT